jgi:biotin carboxyl carrier protein
VLTLERTPDQPWRLGEIELLRLTCDLCAPRLIDLYQQDKWLGAKAADGLRKGLGRLVGPTHTWAKVTAVLVLAAVLFLTLVRGPDRVEGTFVIEADNRRPIPAPFDGTLLSVEPGIEPGARVEAGRVLASLDIHKLMDQLDSARSEMLSYQKEAGQAMSEGKTAQKQMAEARAARAQAEVRLLEAHIQEATIKAPISGWVVTGDLKRQTGAPVRTGDLLFEVASLDALQADVYVPEDRITELRVGMRGELASAASPGMYLPFVVERINPVAEVKDQENVFRVRVVPPGDEEAVKGESDSATGKEDRGGWTDAKNWLRPGMEGVAKVEVGRKPYGWLWTRSLVNWVRMKLWI